MVHKRNLQAGTYNVIYDTHVGKYNQIMTKGKIKSSQANKYNEEQHSRKTRRNYLFIYDHGVINSTAN